MKISGTIRMGLELPRRLQEVGFQISVHAFHIKRHVEGDISITPEDFIPGSLAGYAVLSGKAQEVVVAFIRDVKNQFLADPLMGAFHHWECFEFIVYELECPVRYHSVSGLRDNFPRHGLFSLRTALNSNWTE